MPDPVLDDSGKVIPPDESKKDDGSKLSDDPIQKLGNEIFSRIGRLDAEHRKDRQLLLNKIEELKVDRERQVDNVSFVPQDDSNPAMKAMNDRLSERALSGDFFGAVDEALTTRQKAEEMLRIRKETLADKVIQGMENMKYFKEVEKDVRANTKQLISDGYAPADAAAYAYEKARADHLDKLVSRETNADINLEMLEGGGGYEDSGAKKGKLNTDGKKAWLKNKDQKYNGKPLFKDEADFIAQMSSRVRERYVG